MSKKNKLTYICESCEYKTVQWVGKCPNCHEWNSMMEFIKEDKKQIISNSIPILFSDLEGGEHERTQIGVKEFDRVLGGGLVQGSLVLIGGEPGIGKSTLLLQVCSLLSQQEKVLYVSGEESSIQTSNRYKRLGSKAKDLFFLYESNCENILEKAKDLKPKFLIIDSIQTTYSESSQSTPGSVSQVRDVTFNLMNFCKEKDITCLLVGHVTKEGNIAGPKILEHMVDTVIYFEGDQKGQYRILRAIKNRFGNINEIGIFEMLENGLREIRHPSQCFIERPLKGSYGRTITCVLEGTRTIFVEVQALVIENFSENINGRRTSQGIDQKRLSMLIAVLEKYLGLSLGSSDIYVNIVGGIKLDGRDSDLAILVALLSSLRKIPISSGKIFMGEVGLTGEIRSTPRADLKLKEISHLNYDEVVLSKTTESHMKDKFDLKILGLERVQELETYIFS